MRDVQDRRTFTIRRTPEGERLIATIFLDQAPKVTAEDMTASDGVLIGGPVHISSMDWQVKKMIDTVCSGL